MLGIAFKAGTDDLRESPAVELAEHLLGKGCILRIHDEHVALDAITGANREYLLSHLPHLAALLHDNLTEVLDWADVLVVTQSSPLYSTVGSSVRSDQRIVDLSGIGRGADNLETYEGLTWR